MFDTIVNEMDNLCRETAQRCAEAYHTLRAAEDAARAKQGIDESPVKYKARQATAAAKLEDARKLQRDLAFDLPQEAESKGNALRRQLEAAIADKYAADPADVDANTLTLLQSGILTPPEYARLFEKATSPTMRRLIGKSAGDAARTTQDAENARILRNVEYQAMHTSGSEYLVAFDGLCDILRRSAKNPTFCDRYSELAAPYLDVFRR